MKANLIFFFSYHKKPEKEQDKKISGLLMNFVDFCERTDFNLRTLPRIGETILIHDFVFKWIKKEKPDDPTAEKMFYKALKTGDFKVFNVSHSLSECTIYCEEKDIKATE